MDAERVTRYAGERLGMEIQALSRTQIRVSVAQRLAVWRVMTERADFYLVESGGEIELFRANRMHPKRVSADDCSSALAAAQHFLELHPARPDPVEPRVPAVDEGESAPVCQKCAAALSPRGRPKLAGPRLCRRCRHAQRARERYRANRAFRAQRRVRSADNSQRTPALG